MASDGISLCQFRTDSFKYNGIDMSNKYNLYFVTTSDNSSSSSNVLNNGLSINLVEDDDTGDIKSFSQAKRNYFDIDVTIAKIVDNNIQPVSKTDMDEINMILFRSKYYPLEVDGLIINCIITKSTSYFNNTNQGYINLTLHCEPYYRSAIITKDVVVTTSKDLTLENNSNVDGLLDLNVHIQLFNSTEYTTNTTYIKIVNLTNGTMIEFDNLSTDDEQDIVVYGESPNGISMNYVQSTSDATLNILKKMITRQWLKLSYGVNRFQVICNGKCRVIFSYQNKVMLR